MSQRGRRRLPRSIALAAQLLLIFVGLVAGSTIVLTVAAYRRSLDSLEADARRMARVAAETRDDAMTQLFVTRHQRAEGFLAGVESLCSEDRDDGGFAFSEPCVRTMVEEFRTTERALGVQLLYRGRTLSIAGATGAPVVQPGAIASITRHADGSHGFGVVAARGAMLLQIEFSEEDVDSLFAQRSGLGESGEVFLTDALGEPLSPLRVGHADTAGSALPLEPLAECREGPGEVIASDYRGVQTVHSFRPASVLDGGCIDAHINHAEAMEPGEELRTELASRGSIFVLIGALVSLMAAHRISAPVRRLAVSARQLQTGQFGHDVPIGGPSEVRALGEALSAMAAELDKLVRREQAARRDAESANRSKDHFLTTLSHELRTPLNAIFGWARLMRTGDHDRERIDRATLAIERSADSLRRLVDDLLDVSRIVSGRLRLVRAPFRLTGAVEGALDAVRPQAAERGVRLESHLEADEVMVRGDQQRLQQVFWNLLWNAIKFTPSGGLVRVSLRVAGESAELKVADTGMGISADVLPEIFEWYRQVDAGEHAGDTGLGVGLGLVKQLVELHGGAVVAESDGAGRGATFVVTLPVMRENGEATVQEAPQPPATPAKPLASISILLVENDREWRDAAQVLLSDAGATVRVAESAPEARRAVATFAPDVLVSDIAMPDEDGYALMQSLRQGGATFPAVALTALARREDAERSRLAGFQVHMPKPVDPMRLVDTLATLARTGR